MNDSTLGYVDAPPYLSDDSVAVEAIYRKITPGLMSFLLLCWALNYFDRVNISFTQLQLKQDLEFSGAAYGLGVSPFFIDYILFEVPSTLLPRRIGARKTVTRIMLLQGTIPIAMAFMNAPRQFYPTRTPLGAARAGFWPGVILYLSLWYPAQRRARITPRFLLATVVAGITGSPLSGLIPQNFTDVWGFRNWQWLLFIESLPAVLAGVFAWFYLVDKPQDAKWLTTAQKRIIMAAPEEEHRQKSGSAPSCLMVALRDPCAYVIATGQATVPVCGTTLNYWTPTIIKQTGISSMLEIGFLSVSSYIVGAVAILLITRSSDMRPECRWHSFPSTTAGAAGATLLMTLIRNPAAVTVCLSLVSVSYSAAVAIIWTISPNYLKDGATVGGIDVISSLGQIGVFLAPIVLGRVKTVTGSSSAGILLVAVPVFAGGIAVLFGVPRQQQAPKSGVRERTQWIDFDCLKGTSISKPKFSVTMDSYDWMRPLIDGGVQIDSVDPVFMPQDPEEIFFRAFCRVDYDICELSLGSYSVKAAAGTSPYITVPVFSSRAFRHSSIYVRVDRDVSRPEDLKGKRIDVSGYQLMANVWVRMFPEEEYGVKTSDIRWVHGGYRDPMRMEKTSLRLPEGITFENAPEGRTISNLLTEGEIDGVIGLCASSCSDRGHPQVKHLFDDPQKSAAEWYERRRLFPIMHTLGIRKTLTEQHPWLLGAIVKAFEHSKEVAPVRLSDTSATKVTLPFVEDQLCNARRLMGHDFWSYGFANSEHVIDRFLVQHHAEGPSSRRLQPAGLFHPASLKSFKI